MGQLVVVTVPVTPVGQLVVVTVLVTMQEGELNTATSSYPRGLGSSSLCLPPGSGLFLLFFDSFLSPQPITRHGVGKQT